ncbi:MAG TPA: AAA family ATPase [Clostridiaceae bacterium]|nr:AAA family ATPase [Clostridiaceae bacterium]
MYIEKIEIDGFGKICNLTINFNKGLNIVFGLNESGKTTIQWFIRGMLFGLKGGRASKDGVPPPLRRYKPWNADIYRGALEYRLNNGELYRIERDFETGKVCVYDGMYNDVTSQFTSSIEKGAVTAEKHLFFNEACFDKTGFIRQMESGIDESGKKELLSRITNVMETGYEDISFRKAEKALKDSIIEYVGSDRSTKRPLDRISLRLEELKKSRDNLINSREVYWEISKKLDLERETIKITGEKKDLLKNAEDFLRIRKEVEKCRRQIRELRSILSEAFQIEQNLKKASQELEYFEKLRFSTHKETEIKSSTIKRKEDNLKITALKKKRKVYVAGMAVFSLISLLLILTDFFIKNSWIKISSSIFAALAVLAAFLASRITSEREKSPEDYDENPSGELKYDRYIEKVSSVMELENNLKEKLSRAYIITGIGINSTEDIKNILQKLEKKYNDYLETLRNYARDMTGGNTSIIATQDRELWMLDMENVEKPLSDSDIESIELMLDYKRKRIEEEYTLSIQKITEYEVLLKTLENEKDELQKIDEEIEELNQKKRNLESLDFSLRTALEVLTQSSKEIQRDYIPMLNNKMSSLIGKITGSKYNDIRADEKLQVRAVEPVTGKVTNTNILSGGTLEQVYLALRLSMAEMIENPEEKIPFFMDEVFAHYDDSRINSSLRLLEEISSQRQIILFTCKGREVEAAARVCKDGLNIIRL